MSRDIYEAAIHATDIFVVEKTRGIENSVTGAIRIDTYLTTLYDVKSATPNLSDAVLGNHDLGAIYAFNNVLSSNWY